MLETPHILLGPGNNGWSNAGSVGGSFTSHGQPRAAYNNRGYLALETDDDGTYLTLPYSEDIKIGESNFILFAFFTPIVMLDNSTADQQRIIGFGPSTAGETEVGISLQHGLSGLCGFTMIVRQDGSTPPDVLLKSNSLVLASEGVEYFVCLIGDAVNGRYYCFARSQSGGNGAFTAASSDTGGAHYPAVSAENDFSIGAATNDALTSHGYIRAAGLILDTDFDVTLPTAAALTLWNGGEGIVSSRRLAGGRTTRAARALRGARA